MRRRRRGEGEEGPGSHSQQALKPRQAESTSSNLRNFNFLEANGELSLPIIDEMMSMHDGGGSNLNSPTKADTRFPMWH